MSLGLVWHSWWHEEGLPSSTRPREKQVRVKPREGAKETGSPGSPIGTWRTGPPQGCSMLGSAAELGQLHLSCRCSHVLLLVVLRLCVLSLLTSIRHFFSMSLLQCIWGFCFLSQFQLTANCSVEWPIGALTAWPLSASSILRLS